MDRRQVRTIAALSIALWWARRVARQRLHEYDPAGHVPASKLMDVMTGKGGEDFERLTVEQFLIHAFNSPYPFEGEEWADRRHPCGKCGEQMIQARYPSGAVSWTCPECSAGTRDRINAASEGLRADTERKLPDVLEPPLVRVRCSVCGKQKDAWVDEAGRLEDERDQWCMHNDDSVHPTELFEED